MSRDWPRPLTAEDLDDECLSEVLVWSEDLRKRIAQDPEAWHHAEILLSQAAPGLVLELRGARLELKRLGRALMAQEVGIPGTRTSAVVPEPVTDSKLNEIEMFLTRKEHPSGRVVVQVPAALELVHALHEARWAADHLGNAHLCSPGCANHDRLKKFMNRTR